MIAACIVLAVLLLLFCLYLLVLLRPAKPQRVPAAALFTDYAHRGLWNAENGIPENSLPAFRRAAEAKFGIELDLQLSRDGIVMVFHDENLRRMTGKDAKLSDLTFDELRALRLGNTDEVIPTLREVLAAVDSRVPLLIELKGESTDTALCPVADALLCGYAGPYCIESFNPFLLDWYKKNRPDVYRGLLYTNVVREKKKASAANLLLTAAALNFIARPHFIAYDERVKNALPVKVCTRLYRAGKFTWTVRSLASYDAAYTDGACPIFERFIPARK